MSLPTKRCNIHNVNYSQRLLHRLNNRFRTIFASSLYVLIPALIALSLACPKIDACAEVQIDAKSTMDSIAVNPPEQSTDSLSAQIKENLSDTSRIDTTVELKHSPTGAMWRSLALPGWGQLYNRKYLKAVIIGGVEIGLITAILVQHQRYKKAREENEWFAADYYEDDRNRLTWWLAGIIIYSMADAYVDGHLWNFELQRDLSANVGINDNGIFLKIKW